MYCLAEWGHLTEDEAFAAFEFIGGFAGDDDEVDKVELEAAFTALHNATEEEIAEYVEKNGATREPKEE